MARAKTSYVCRECGYENPRWMGKCPECGAWNTMQEVRAEPQEAARPMKRRGGIGEDALPMRDISTDSQIYQPTGIGELDRVLGGGIVEGALVLVGGEPGIGKSTLLLQMSASLSGMGKKVLYISGEESRRQIKLRARRLGADESDVLLLSENAMDKVREKLEALKPDYCIVDSVQTMYLPELSSAPGSVSQVRESTAILMRYAKESGCGIVLVGHVTKEGSLAGPRVLEHMVDAVLYFEGDKTHEYRLLRAAKNRFGSVNELGVFEMASDGMREVKNASESLLSARARGASGSCVLCAMEGTRPVLVDIQALAARSYYQVPRRTVNGMDNSRVILLLAVMEKRAGLRLYDKDVYINVAGGLDLSEPAADLAVCCSVASSMCDRPLPQDVCVMGEVGLAGEVRAIPRLDRRVQECARLGFTTIVCPRDSASRLDAVPGVEVRGVDTIAQAFAVLDVFPSGRG